MPSTTRRRVLAGAAAACSTSLVGASASRARRDARRDPEREQVSAPEDDLVATVRETVATALRDHDADGATVAVVSEGEAVLTEGFGHAYRAPDVPVDPASTLFRIGSVSKVFTFVAAMALVDRGRLDPDAPVGDVLESVPVPDEDAYDDPVTLSHLATHTAGFEECSPGQFRTTPENLRSLPEALRANDPARVQPPGAVPMYTNYNAGLAGQLVADVQDTTFAAAVRRLVFDPLGMTESTFDQTPDALVGGQTGVTEELGWYSEMTPASGMASTAADMARFVRAVAGDGGRVLSPSAVEALHRQWYTPHERLAGAAFGTARQRRGGTLVVGHHGGVPDFASDLRVLPGTGSGLFVSVHGADAGEVQAAVTAAFLDEVAPVSEPETTTDGPPSRGDDLTGTYRSVLLTDAASFEKPLFLVRKPATTVRVAKSGHLVTERRGSTHRWVELTPLVFRRTDGEDTLVFRETAGGNLQLFRASEPRVAFESVPWYGEADRHGSLALAAGAVALTGTVGWPLAAAWRRLRGGSPPPGAVTRSRWAAGTSVLSLVAFAAFGLVAIVGGGLYVHPSWLGLLFALPVVGAFLAMGAAGYAVQAWRRGQGSRFARVTLSAVVAGVTVLYALLWYWNLLRVRP